jgi:curli production assembly/transport component CsgF
MKKYLVFALLLTVLFSTIPAGADQLTFKFISPSFGGDPNNGPFLLNEAQMQNGYKAPATPQPSALDQFNTILNQQILYQLTQKLTASAFGESGGLQPGTYQMGSFNVTVSTGANGLTCNIVDTSTGQTTTVQIPYY